MSERIDVTKLDYATRVFHIFEVLDYLARINENKPEERYAVVPFEDKKEITTGPIINYQSDPNSIISGTKLMTIVEKYLVVMPMSKLMRINRDGMLPGDFEKGVPFAFLSYPSARMSHDHRTIAYYLDGGNPGRVFGLNEEGEFALKLLEEVGELNQDDENSVVVNQALELFPIRNKERLEKIAVRERKGKTGPPPHALEVHLC